ncbi:MAG TPA: hypothetical protein VGI81_27445 [Tepidisphaeraceae bacterium]
MSKNEPLDYATPRPPTPADPEPQRIAQAIRFVGYAIILLSGVIFVGVGLFAREPVPQLIGGAMMLLAAVAIMVVMLS